MPAIFAVNATVLGASHQLYAHVHHHYGLNDAFDRSVSILLAQKQSAAGTVQRHGQQQHRSGSRVESTKYAGADSNLTRAAASKGSSNSAAAAGGSFNNSNADRRSAAEKAAVVASSASTALEQATATVANGTATALAGQPAVVRSGRRLQAPLGLLRRLLSSVEPPTGKAEHQQKQEGRALGHEVELLHPCLHEGYRQQYSRLRQDGIAMPDPPRVVLVGR